MHYSLVVSKTGKIIISVIVVAVVIVAVVMVYGLVVNQPHFGFPSKNQVNSDTGQKYSTTSTSKTNVSNESLFNFTGVVNVSFMKYSNGTNGSYLMIMEYQFSSASKSTQSYSTILGYLDALGEFAKVASNSTYGPFQYSEFSILDLNFISAHSGTFSIFLLSYGISQSALNATFHSTVSSMTTFNL